MADPRKPVFSILIRPTKEGAPSRKVSFYPAELWPNQDGRKGTFRLKVGVQHPDRPGDFSESWHPGPRVYEFMTPVAALGLVMEMCLGKPVKRRSPRRIPVGTPVRIRNTRADVRKGAPEYDLSRTATRPVRLADGRDYVVVLLVGRGMVHVPLDDVEVIQARVKSQTMEGTDEC